MRPIILCAIALLSCSATSQTRAADSNFAVISPEAAKALVAHRSSAEADAIIGEAVAVDRMRPSAQPTVHAEGMTSTRDFYVMKDWPKMLALSLAWRLTGDRRHLDELVILMNAWLDTYTLSQHPIVETEACMVWPVPDPGTGCLDPIDDANLSTLFMAYDIAETDLSRDIHDRVIRLAHNVSESYLADCALRKVSSSPWAQENFRNNWQSYRVMLITLAAYLTGDPSMIDGARQSFQTQIEANMVYPVLEPCGDGRKCARTINDGSVMDFHQRDAIRYVVSDLEPLALAALAAQAHGQDWYQYVSPNGASLTRAFRWLQPYVSGEKSHDEFANTSVAFDRKRGEIGWKGYSGQWDPNGGRTLFRMALRLDQKLATPPITSIAQSSYETTEYDPKTAREPQYPLIGFVFFAP
jgi:Alginate lyase